MRDDHRRLFRLARRRGDRLRDLERERARDIVIGSSRTHVGRAGLPIPQHELVEIHARRVGKTAHEFLNC